MSETATAAITRPAEARAAAPDLPLVEYFQRFFERVVRMKRALVSAEAETGVESAEIVQQELLDILGQQSAEIQVLYGSGAVETLKRAQYVMAALADETFIHLEWSGRDVWRDRLLLEASLFGTFRAGDEVFRRIDELIIGQTPSDYAIASIYLMALGLGFEGKYRRWENGKEKLNLHRTRLMGFLVRRRPELDDPQRKLMPEAYAHTTEDSLPAEIPDPRRWFWGLAVVLIAWLLVSHFIWIDLTESLTQTLDRILDRP